MAIELFVSVLKYAVIVSICVAPIFVFSVKPDAQRWKKSITFLIPVFLFVLAVGVTSSFHECFYHQNNGCWEYKLIWLVLGVLLYITGLGWCEIVWRQYYKLPSWPLKENIKYGVVSNTVILVSIMMSVLVLYIALLNLVWFPLFSKS